MKFVQFLDYLVLGISSFVLSDVSDSGDLSKARPSLMWMYFVGPEIRAIMYLGFAGSIVSHNVLSYANDGIYSTISRTRIGFYSTITLLTVTALVNLFSPKLSNIRKSNWSSLALPTSKADIGTFWIGGGDGEWFAFLGHNGEEQKTILPQEILDQMSVGQKHTDFKMEEVFEEANASFTDDSSYCADNKSQEAECN